MASKKRTRSTPVDTSDEVGPETVPEAVAAQPSEPDRRAEMASLARR